MTSQYIWIDHLSDLPNSLLAEPVWYLDTEFMRERTFYAQLALLQVRAAEQTVLIDATQLTNTAELGKLLAERTLVMHACSEDIDVLSHTTGMPPVQMEDTQLAAALAGFPLQLSYQKLVAEICNVDLPKSATRSNWLKRPLTPTQLDYAADDVLYLPAIREALRERLHTLGRLTWWQQENQRQLKQVLETLPDNAQWKKVKGVGTLNDTERGRLQSLAAWREVQARKRDIPRTFVARNGDLLTLARQAPSNRQQLAAMDLPRGLLKHQGDRLLQLMQQIDPNSVPAALPEPLDDKQKQTLKRLKKIVGEVADDLGVVKEVLARRRWLEDLIRQPDNLPAPMAGWRQEVITAKLLEAL